MIHVCGCGKSHRLAIHAVSKVKAIRIDPTRTATLRARMLADVNRRFKALARDIYEAIVEQDILELNEPNYLSLNAICRVPAGVPEGGQFSSCDGVVGDSDNYYHGTSIENAQKIRTEGLKPTHRVWVSKSENYAINAAFQTSGDDQLLAIVVVKKTPETMNLFNDYATSKDLNVASRDPIPPHAIAEVRVYSKKQFPIGKPFKKKNPAPLQVYEAVGDDGDVLYVAVLLPFSPGIQAHASPDPYTFPRSAAKITAFLRWLKQKEKDHILTVVTRPGRIGGTVEEAWTDMYIDSAYQQGIRMAGQELKRQGVNIPIPAGRIGRDPVTLTFNSPVHADRVGLLYTRVFNELKGITNAMDQQISSVLAQGMAEGRNPLVIARDIVNRVEKIGITRARTLARTEIVRAHHMASVQEYRNAGVLGVTVKSEWLTAGFNVCPVCLPLEGKIFTLDQIEPMIPRHPNCRCRALPHIEGIS